MNLRRLAQAAITMAGVLLAVAAPASRVVADEVVAPADAMTCEGAKGIDHARDLRQALGLEVVEASLAASFDDPAYSCERYGIPLTPKEVDEFDAIVAAQSELSELAEAVSGNPDFGGAYLDGANLTIRSTTGLLRGTVETLSKELPPAASVEIAPADYSQKDLDEVSDAIAANLASYLDAGVQVSMVTVDARTNRVTIGVTTDVPAAQKVLGAEFGDMVEVTSEPSRGGDWLVCNINDCGTKGGLTIVNNPTGDRCTSGFLVKAKFLNTGVWDHYLLTAGHCTADVPANSHWRNGSSTVEWGIGWASDFWPQTCGNGDTCHYNDLGLIHMGGVTPANWNRYYVGAGVWVEVTGSTSRANQLVGQTLCYTGSTSLHECGTLTKKPDVMCLNFCSLYLYDAVETNAQGAEGDSGAGIYRPWSSADHDYANAYGILSIGGGAFTYYWPAYNDLFSLPPGFHNRNQYLVRPCSSPACAL